MQKPRSVARTLCMQMNGGPDKNCHWFYCDENYVYFSEEKNNVNNELKEEIELKNEQRTNMYNPDEKDLKCIKKT